MLCKMYTDVEYINTISYLSILVMYNPNSSYLPWANTGVVERVGLL